ncbi:MAG: hypothetical protein NXY57DRAFT_1044077 [Lentinula lateritia]|nr:MAG: hypothetical protein NXY57DRAFT_1044077 [Lentinula lateritia]
MDPALFQPFLILVPWSLSVFLPGLHVPCPWPPAWTCSAQPKWPFKCYKYYLKIRLQQSPRRYRMFLRRRHLSCFIFMTSGWVNLPAFLRDDLEQQWGIPPEHRSPTSGVRNFEQFPAIPIPFCLRFHEGSAIMRLVPSRDLDPFASLRGQVSSPHFTRSKDSDNELLSENPALDIAPRASSSSKASSVKMGSKPKASVKVVEESKVSDPTPSASVYKRVRLPPHSRKIAPTTSKGKSRQIIATNEDEDEDEDSVPPPKSSLPRCSAKRVSVPKQVTKAAVKPAPKHSSGSTFQPVLLADAQGRLKLPEQSTGNFTPFPKFAHARNSAALNRENPPLAINPEFLELGSILETQNARFTMQDLMQPSIPSHFGTCSRGFGGQFGKFGSPARIQVPGMLLTEFKVFGPLLAVRILTQIRSLFDTTKELFLWSILDLQNAGEDPIVVLEALKAAEPNRRAISLNNPFNLSGLDFDNRTPGEWIELLCSIHSGESTAHIDDKGHLVESSPPPDSATEALEGLNKVEKESADEGASSLVGGSIPMELDLPMIESLAEPALSPEKGAEEAQTLES